MLGVWPERRKTGAGCLGIRWARAFCQDPSRWQSGSISFMLCWEVHYTGRNSVPAVGLAFVASYDLVMVAPHTDPETSPPPAWCSSG